MTIYLLQWSDTDTPKRKAYPTYKQAETEWKVITRDSLNNKRIGILDKEEAITKIIISLQQDIINLINSFN